MSKKSKAESKERRAKEKSRRKAANRAYYESLRDSGHNSKRAARAVKAGKKVKTTKHRLGACGNIGCAKCSPIARELKLEKKLKSEGFNTRLV
jgi:hypothetical protein